MGQCLKILRRKEYLGFILGALVVFAVYELNDTGLAIVCLLILLAGFPLAQKFGT